LDAALANAIALWAEASSDPESRRAGDLRRNKLRAVARFFARAGKLPADVTPLEVRAWRAELEARGLAAATVYARLSFLSSFFTWLLADPVLGQGIATNPVRLARPRAPRAYQTEATKALSDEQLARLVEVIRARAAAGELAALRDYVLFLWFLLSGMRRAEVLALRGQEVELREEGIVVTCKVKGGDYQARLLSQPALRAALENYLQASGREDALTKGGPLWVRHDQGREAAGVATPLTGWGFAQRMKAYARAAGIEHFHLHQTRHTFARIVAEASGSLFEVQDALAHKHPATTRVYVQRLAVKRDKFGDEIAKRMRLR
jgi:integrase